MKKIFVILTTILLLCGCSNTVSNKAAHVKPDISMECHLCRKNKENFMMKTYH